MALLDSDKIMFEVYREEGYNRRYRVVYFTELTEVNKEQEINRALAGEQFLDGFIRGYDSIKAKVIIDNFLKQLAEDDSLTPDILRAQLGEHLVD